MKTFRVEYRPSVKKSLKKFPKADQKRILDKMDAIAENLPAPSITKMKGEDDFHKIRIGNYRVIYQIHEDVLSYSNGKNRASQRCL